MMAKAAEKKSRKSGRGPGKPLGTRNGYTKKVRRQGDALQRDARVRFENSAQRSFVLEAATSLSPVESLSQFTAVAALVRASVILGRPSPQSVEAVASPTIAASA